MEDITNADYTHAKTFCKDFEKTSLGEYQNLHVQSDDTLLLADLFENFTSISLASSLKNSKVKLDLLTDIDMLLIVEKDIRRGICHPIHRYAKA